MRILVTGAAGYIAGHTIAWLAQHGHEIWALDKHGHYKTAVRKCCVKCLVPSPAGLEHTLGALCEHVEAIIHLGARAAVGDSVTRPLLYYQDNVAFTIQLLQAMHDKGVDKLVFASSAGAYKSWPACEQELRFNAKRKLNEDDELEPLNPYARTKVMCEQLIADTCRAHALKAVALRFFNVCGTLPGLPPYSKPPHHIIPRILLAIRDREKLVLNGRDYETPDCTVIRDYVNVLDVAGAIARSLEHLETAPNHFYDVFNVGTGTPRSLLEIVHNCEHATSRKLDYEWGPRRAGDPASLVADLSKIERQLGWTPAVPSIFDIIDSVWRAIRPASQSAAECAGD